MNHHPVSAIAVAVAAVFTGHALAQDNSPKTRDQVRAELAEAIRTGNMVGDGETGRKLHEMFPGSYPGQSTAMENMAHAAVQAGLSRDGHNGQRLSPTLPGQTDAHVEPQGKTRAEVEAELVQAILNGDMMADGETGRTFRQMYPGSFASD